MTCPLEWDNREKSLLIPHKLEESESIPGKVASFKHYYRSLYNRLKPSYGESIIMLKKLSLKEGPADH